MELLEFFNHLVPADFMPHGYCYLWDPWLVWLNVASDGLITLSYYGIPVVLIYFIHKRRDLPFNWIFWMFGGFILACGTTHLMEIWNVWHASYLLAGVIKAVTAAISVITLILLIPLLPQAIGIHDLMGLQERNRSLEAQIAARKRLEDAQLDAPFRHRMMAGAALAVFFVGFMGFLSWRSGRLAATESDRVTQTHAVMQALQSTLGNIVETETAAGRLRCRGTRCCWPTIEPPGKRPHKESTPCVNSRQTMPASSSESIYSSPGSAPLLLSLTEWWPADCRPRPFLKTVPFCSRKGSWMRCRAPPGQSKPNRLPYCGSVPRRPTRHAV